ncbi:P-loop containing nucleoside triphosphate hydrolase protein [Fusarium avenaceum]|nr:P-loop containing nucleoside triphosphate hydrolase protein [Fusarium avenaceum]
MEEVVRTFAHPLYKTPALHCINACCDYLEARIKKMKVEEPALRPPLVALMSHFDVCLGSTMRWTSTTAIISIQTTSSSRETIEARKLHPKIPGKRLRDHQELAAGAALLASKSRFKGMILADPPGLGKTLTALAVASLRGGTSIVVAPTSCANQWKQEVHRFFGNYMPCISLLTEEATPVQLHQYRIVITSYHQIAAELGRKERCLAAVADYETQEPGSQSPPKRPSLTILSSIFEQKVARTIILDEVYSTKNTSSRMYRAIHRARQLANFCLMMSDTPVDNTFMSCLDCSVDTISLRRGECDGHSLARQPGQATPNIATAGCPRELTESSLSSTVIWNTDRMMEWHGMASTQKDTTKKRRNPLGEVWSNAQASRAPSEKAKIKENEE